MNRVINAFTFIFLTLFLCIINVNADTACTNKELAGLNKTAGLIKTNYEVVENVTHVDADLSNGVYEADETSYSFKISLFNITNDIFIIGTNDLDNNKINISYNDTTDGKYTFISNNEENIIKYTFIVYSNLDNCKAKSLRTFTFIKPKYNSYFNYQICQDNPNISYCKQFITKDINISESELYNKIFNINNNTTTKVSTNKTRNKIINFFKNNYLYVIGGIIIIFIISTIIIVINKKRSEL